MDQKTKYSESENIFTSEDEEENYNFEYVSKNQCQYDIDDIKRERIKKDEENIWASFIEREDEEGSECLLDCFHNVINPRQVLENNLEEVHLNQELKRLEQDAFLEETERLTKPKKKLSRINYDVKSHNDDDDRRSCDTYIEVQKAYEDPLVYERSPISKLDFKTKISKSRYENTIRHQRKLQHQRSCIFRDYNCRECDLSPGITSHNSDQYSSIIRPHPIVAQKILDIQVKISELLDEIHYRLCRIPIPDGEIDLKRRQQRMMEFIVRFSRNYLYDISRQMADIQRHIQMMLPNARIKPSRRISQLHMQALETKLCSIHQLLFNALCAYCKHIPSSCLKGHPGKLKEILQIVMDLKDVCSKINLTAEYFGAGDAASPPLGEDTQKRCNAILSKLYSNSEKASPIYSYTTQSTLRSSIDTKRRNIRTDSRKMLPNRFSMYYADNRFAKSQKKRPITVGFCMKERKPNIGKLKLIDHPSTATIPVSNVILKNPKEPIKRGPSRAKRFQKEDDIKTMVEMIPVDSEEGNSAILSRACHSSISNINRKVVKRAVKSRQRDKNSKPSTTTTTTTKSSKQNFNSVVKDQNLNGDLLLTNQQFCSFLPIITHVISLITEKQKKSPININEMTMETLLEILQEYLVEKNKETEEEFLIDSIKYDTANSMNKPLQKSEIFHHNTKKFSSKTNNKKKVEEEKQSVKTSLYNIENEENPKLIPLIVSQESIDELLDYRNKFQDACRLNPMYTSNSPNKPWEVVAWIADKLVDEMIAEISKELQIDDIIQKLFDLEFQEF
ncbi:uncharacterized protein [Chelonus insularis]|uniref:uncharacterized protein isoform X2 n=1 Tax=Chelonus insularis TaxID=460826 RepID=UPI00158AA2B1|nr:uncharacterized protein LOC118073110 isoform X2 [Chelonus insularis]